MVAVVFICIAGILCLAPVAAYLRWLAALNRGDRPAVIAGPWDFAALLAALSGFLVFGGGVLVAALQSNVRAVIRGNLIQVREIAAADWYAWAAVAGGYFACVVVAVGLTLRSRFGALTAYNLTRDRAAIVVKDALAALGIAGRLKGDSWAFDGGSVGVEPFDGFRTVTFRLAVADPHRRQDLERAIRVRLAEEPVPESPVRTTLLSAATVVGCAAGSFVVMIAYLLYAVYS